MTRTFLHEFDPPASSPVPGPNVELTVQEIEDAGLREVLQTPGAPFGSWAILDALLQPTGDGTPFIFREPLGEAREVKVALSGLLGRFVARAYLGKYCGLSIFGHLGRSTIKLDGRRRIEIVRLARGDLPDWVACTSSLSDLTVAEAKGSHYPCGPERALNRAWDQAGRIDVRVSGTRATLKRLAIVTRWGMRTGGPSDPRISVRDPIDEGEPINPDDEGAIFVGLLRYHVANMLAPLGHTELADSIRRLATADSKSDEWRRQEVARVDGLLDAADKMTLEDFRETRDLLGGLVTRAGPLRQAGIYRSDQKVLARLDVRPVFVGIERELVHAAVDGDPLVIRELLTGRRRADGAARCDGAGGWIVPLGDEAGNRS